MVVVVVALDVVALAAHRWRARLAENDRRSEYQGLQHGGHNATTEQSKGRETLGAEIESDAERAADVLSASRLGGTDLIWPPPSWRLINEA